MSRIVGYMTVLILPLLLAAVHGLSATADIRRAARVCEAPEPTSHREPPRHIHHQTPAAQTWTEAEAEPRGPAGRGGEEGSWGWILQRADRRTVIWWETRRDVSKSIGGVIWRELWRSVRENVAKLKPPAKVTKLRWCISCAGATQRVIGCWA